MTWHWGGKGGDKKKTRKVGNRKEEIKIVLKAVKRYEEGDDLKRGGEVFPTFEPNKNCSFGDLRKKKAGGVLASMG